MTPRLVLRPNRLHPITMDTGVRVTVRLRGRVIADTQQAITLRESKSAPVQYIPRADVEADVLRPSDHATYCPFKGAATYFSLVAGEDVRAAAAWAYPEPHAAVAEIKDHVAFHPDHVDSIEVHHAA
jgi:uncharacterized protein (DUF427 family)